MKTQNKKTLTIVLSAILVIAIAVGATLAYLSATTNDVENVFTFVDNIKGVLTEPTWDPDEALNLTPGAFIPKDPQITNTSENGVVEYAAIKLTFFNGAGDVISVEDPDDMAKLLGLIDIDWGDSWTRVNGDETSAEQIWVYDYTLPQGVTTDPLFYSVTIKNITSQEQLWLRGDYGHAEGCYEAGDCDCTVTWRHHEKCAIFGEAGAENTAKGGELEEVGKCNCNAAEVHDPRCPSLIKTLTGECGHNTVISGLGNFTIKAEGAVVQADAFTDAANAAPALISLFS